MYQILGESNRKPELNTIYVDEFKQMNPNKMRLRKGIVYLGNLCASIV